LTESLTNLHGSPGIALNPSVEGIGGAILQYRRLSGVLWIGSRRLHRPGNKVGNKRFHGTLFEYFRNDVLDAYPYLFGLQVPQAHGAAEPVRRFG